MKLQNATWLISGLQKLMFASVLVVSPPNYADNPGAFPISWKHLSDVAFKKKLNQEMSMYFLYPTFGKSVRQLEGKYVQIKGYMIPVDPESNVYVISAQPMAMCFFCGGAGPESIIELQMRDRKERFKTDAVKTVSGKLKLNPQDVEHLNYILENAEVIQ